MHFDCVQAHSGQMLMPATHFSLGAATAGLLPSAKQTLTYPKSSPYTRIVLQQLKPAGVSIRIATLADMPQLLELEAYWRSEVLSADEATLTQRLKQHPTGQLVVSTLDGQLLAAMYTQRVASYECLLTASRASELSLHVPNGPVVQLLGVVMRPQARLPGGASAGQALRDYVLHLGRLDATVERACGITRCRDYEPSKGLEYQSHVDAGTDAGLRFHSDAGARIGHLVPAYRPRDTANLGYGVMITYEFSAEASSAATLAAAASAASEGASSGAGQASTTGRGAAEQRGQPAWPSWVGSRAQCEALICGVVDGLQYGSKRTWGPEALRTAFMDLGLDSLDATKFVRELNGQLAPHMELASTAIFDFADIRELGAHLYEEMGKRAPKAAAGAQSATARKADVSSPWRGAHICQPRQARAGCRHGTDHDGDGRCVVLDVPLMSRGVCIACKHNTS